MSTRSTKTKSIRNSIAVGVFGALLGGLLPATALAASPPGAGTGPTWDNSASGTTTSGTTTSRTTTSGSTTSGAPSGTGAESHPPCTPSNLPAAKSFVEGQLKARVVRLERLIAQVGEARGLTASDKAQLQSDLTNELGGMESLQELVPGDATCAALVANAETMVFNYRVYYVMTPQTELVVVSDTETAIASSVVRWEPGLQAAINYEAAHGKDVTEAQEALDDMKIQLTDALGTLAGVSSIVLAQTPSGYPGNHAVFVSARNSCATAFADLGHVRADLGVIVTVLF
jgi:hypothetical protein